MPTNFKTGDKVYYICDDGTIYKDVVYIIEEVQLNNRILISNEKDGQMCGSYHSDKFVLVDGSISEKTMIDWMI